MSKINSLNEKVWNFFASVDLAVALFILISLAAAVGTVIPQSPDPEMLIRFFSKFLPSTTAMKAFEIVNLFDLNNVYHSWWFTFLLFMFALNLVVCSVERLPQLLRSFKTPPQPFSEEILEKMPLKKEVDISSSEFLQKIIEIFKRKKFSVYKFENSGVVQLQLKKWSKSRLAVYLTHFSIIIILAGALIGIFFGFRGSMNIVEGSGANFAISDDGKAIPLGFEVKCDRFEVEFYENSFTPRAYRSHIRIFENGKPVRINEKENITVEVNEPFTYKGITFYQATYGFQPTEHAEFRFNFRDKRDKEYKITARFEENFKIPDTQVIATVIDFSPALGVDEQGRLFNMTTDMINPAVLVEFKEGNKKEQQWILAKVPETWNTPYGNLQFVELWGAQFTGLQVRKDPGVPLIYLGSILMCAGLFITLFLRPVNYFVIIKNKKLKIFHPSSKAASIREKEMEQIIKEIETEVKK